MPPASDIDDLVTELDLGSATGHRKRGAPCSVEIIRALAEDDLPVLAAPTSTGLGPSVLLSVTHAHHQLAQLLARGTPATEAALITGYSPAYISKIRGDRCFAELLVHYGEEREAVFVDVLERMRVLGLSSLDELQARLAEEPEEWSRRELMELAELMLVKSRQAGGGAEGRGTAAVSVNVKFVTAQARSEAPSAAAVDLEYEDIAEE